MVKTLLSYQADPSIANKEGKTALMLGQEKKHGDVVKELTKLKGS